MPNDDADRDVAGEPVEREVHDDLVSPGHDTSSGGIYDADDLVLPQQQVGELLEPAELRRNGPTTKMETCKGDREAAAKKSKNG